MKMALFVDVYFLSFCLILSSALLCGYLEKNHTLDCLIVLWIPLYFSYLNYMWTLGIVGILELFHSCIRLQPIIHIPSIKFLLIVINLQVTKARTLSWRAFQESTSSPSQIWMLFLLLFSFFINYALTCTDNFGGIILEFFIVALYMASHDDDNDNNLSLSFTDYFFYFLTPSFLTSLSCFPLFISFSFLSFLPFQPSYCVIPCPHYKYVIAFHVIF